MSKSDLRPKEDIFHTAYHSQVVVVAYLLLHQHIFTVNYLMFILTFFNR
jgi:hypothetical protein